MSNFIEGKRAVIEAFTAHVPINQILLAQGLREDSLVGNIRRQANKANIPVKMIPRDKMDEKSVRGSHQGVMARVAPYNYAPINAIINKADKHAEKHEGATLVAVLDHITDAGNLGAIIRSVNAVDASGVVIPNKRSAQVNASTYKTSAGAINHVPVAQVSNISNAIKALKDAGFWVAGAVEGGDTLIWNANLKGKIALVMGNEEKGISRLVQRECDFFISLPMQGKVASLNVAQATTACMYEWLRQNI